MTNNPRVVLIAGGSGGIGRACAARFLAAGDSVTIVGRSIASLEDAQDYLTKLTSTQGKLLAIQGDLSHADQAEKIAAEANSKSGRIDILVNAAGAAPRSPKQETNPETWELGMRLKFFPIIFLTHFVLPFMLARKNGAIVNIIGMGGRTPRAGHLVGSAANAALINATKGLAAQYAPFGVRINGINPGITQTPRTLRRFREIAALR